MLALPDYLYVETLYQSARTIVYRARRNADQRRVVIKTVNGEPPKLRDLAELRREYYLARRLRRPGVIQVFGLEAHGHNLALIEEDLEAHSLAEQLEPGRGMPLPQVFAIAVEVLNILEGLHREIIHGNITPGNILWKPETHELRLIDFGASSEISRERQNLLAEHVSDDSLPYIAPERSGRMNRDLDHRADLYSFGATLYHLLTGVPPFAANDRASWIYAHVASQAPAPSELRPDIPELLSELVLRLLAKNPEERYQSARGLRSDLRECQKHWAASATIPRFVLGTADVSNLVRNPQRVCGRAVESATLLAEFRAAAAGNKRVLMVSGTEGVGKSSLVNEIRRPIHRLNGYFADGKFDRHPRQGRQL